MASALATADGTRSGSNRGASSTSQAPSEYSLRRSVATCTASRDFPDPPTPVSVTRWESASARFTEASSDSRPTRLLN